MSALIVVDVQNDFLSTGALPVPDGEAVIPVINQLLERPWDLVVASQDWHPKDHKSFASNHGKKIGEVVILNGLEQRLWPDHCVQGSHGAEFASSLHRDHFEYVIQKGCDPEIDSYSAFFDNAHLAKTPLDATLKKHHIKEVTIVGLATDYCVKYTALDALSLGYKVTLIPSACRGVNLQPNDSEEALRALKEKSVKMNPILV